MRKISPPLKCEHQIHSLNFRIQSTRKKSSKLSKKKKTKRPTCLESTYTSGIVSAPSPRRKSVQEARGNVNIYLQHFYYASSYERETVYTHRCVSPLSGQVCFSFGRVRNDARTAFLAIQYRNVLEWTYCWTWWVAWMIRWFPIWKLHESIENFVISIDRYIWELKGVF